MTSTNAINTANNKESLGISDNIEEKKDPINNININQGK